MEISGDPFPSDWSPPPIEFLNPRPPPSLLDAQGQRGGAETLSKEPELPKADPDLPEDLVFSLATERQQVANPEPGAHGLNSKNYINSLDALLREKWLLVEKFSVSQQDIPQVYPGECVFLPRLCPLPCFLDVSQMNPHNALEDLFLNGPPSQQLFFLRSGILSNLYLHSARASPVPLLQWLFKLLAWPLDMSSRAFALLWDLSVDDLFRQSGNIYSTGELGPQGGHAKPQLPASPIHSTGPADEDVRPWCPMLQEVVELFHSLGAHSPNTDLGPCSRTQDSEANEPQHRPLEVALDTSLGHIYKFLTLCVYARPGAYTDASLLSLIELLCCTSLDTGLRLLPKTNLQQLLLHLLECIREWPGKLQRLCSALSWLSNHHHNLQAIVQLFPDVTPRGRQLRSQLSLAVIARMLGQEEALPLWKEKSQLSLLSRLLGLMKPSALRQHLGFQTSVPCQEQQLKARAELDHKVCYLCHSLLTLAGVVVNSQDVTPEHWGELQLLCMQLDHHICTHIRESPQAMHRTRLKDLATQTYIRWQELSARCQPKVSYFSPWKDI
ncbi:protein FAM178B [Octodon degus]|uniref:Protein FAM178B n=1 Tax=Octodon degus TaxID=10160 RepID=A0A6P6EM74_OCTDE|nr:protein FAM178B [Octodon degus]